MKRHLFPLGCDAPNFFGKIFDVVDVVAVPHQIHRDSHEWTGMFVQSRNLAGNETRVSRRLMPEVLCHLELKRWVCSHVRFRFAIL